MIELMLFLIVLALWNISFSIDGLRVKLTEIYNHSLKHKE